MFYSLKEYKSADNIKLYKMLVDKSTCVEKIGGDFYVSKTK